MLRPTNSPLLLPLREEIRLHPSFQGCCVYTSSLSPLNPPKLGDLEPFSRSLTRSEAPVLGIDAKRAFGLTETPSARGFGGDSSVPQLGVWGRIPQCLVFKLIKVTEYLIGRSRDVYTVAFQGRYRRQRNQKFNGQKWLF